MSKQEIKTIQKWLIAILITSIGFAPYINVAEVLAVAAPRRPILASPAPSATNAAASGTQFTMSATASSSYVQFKQTIYQNEAGTQVVQTNSEATSSVGWSGMDASSSNAYVSGNVTGTAATFSATGLSASTTYYWGAQTIDPDGGVGKGNRIIHDRIFIADALKKLGYSRSGRS